MKRDLMTLPLDLANELISACPAIARALIEADFAHASEIVRAE